MSKQLLGASIVTTTPKVSETWSDLYSKLYQQRKFYLVIHGLPEQYLEYRPRKMAKYHKSKCL